MFSLTRLELNQLADEVNFNNKQFTPKILFDGYDAEDVSNHPMGIWKMQQII